MFDPRQTHNLPYDEASAGTSVNKSIREDQASTTDRLLARLDAVVLFLDHGWRVTYLSPRSDPFLADTREALLGKTFREVFPDAGDSPVFRSLHQEALAASVALHREAYHAPSHKWFEIHLLPFPEGWAVSVRDVTGRKQAEEALATLAAIVASSDDAIFGKTLDGIILTWNGGAERLYGYEAREIIGQPVQTLVPADRQQEWHALMEQLRAGERVDHLETVRVRKDGSLVEVSITVSPVLDAAGHLIGASTIARDITERKLLQERIWQSEQLLQAIVDGSPACIYVKDARGRYLRVNQQALDLNHLTREQMLGKTDAELFPHEIAGPLQAHDQAVLESGRAKTREVAGHLPDGARTFLSVKFPLCGADGIPYAVCGISTDISERVLMEQRKDDFISMASHELKTPLTSLLAYTELLHRLLSQEGHPQALHYLARMDAQLTRLNRLIVELLDMARAQAGQLAFAQETVRIGDLVREAVEHFQPTAPRHRIYIKGQADGEVVGDRERLGQVILNLLSNAAKFSPAVESVVVRMTETPAEVTVSVQGFGIGIAEGHQGRIFERFYRVSIDQKKLFSGLGIGLYLCHQIIGHHGGRIWVSSVEGQGSTFCFALPTKRR